jgi:DNA-binding NarL/FixJ family response regulator
LIPTGKRRPKGRSVASGFESATHVPRSKAVSGSPSRDRHRVMLAVAAQPALICEILARQLDSEPGLLVVSRANDEDRISKVLKDKKPQVLIFDYEGLGPNAESTVHRLRLAAPATRILVLATRSGDETVERILRAGASGLVGKQAEFGLLVRAIRAVAAGEIWANRRVTSLALETLTGPVTKAPGSELTKREQEIADACSRGLRNKEIALRLNISPKTVKGHLNNIFRKLGVNNRFALGLEIVSHTPPKS